MPEADPRSLWVAGLRLLLLLLLGTVAVGVGEVGRLPGEWVMGLLLLLLLLGVCWLAVEGGEVSGMLRSESACKPLAPATNMQCYKLCPTIQTGGAHGRGEHACAEANTANSLLATCA
jgi:hypothetical protein